MIVCDWCRASGKVMYNDIEQVSRKPGDIKRIELCVDCYKKHERAKANAIYIATVELKKEVSK